MGSCGQKASLPLDALSGLRASLDGRVAPERPVSTVGRSGGPVRRRLEAAYLATSGADALSAMSAMIDRATMNDMIRHVEAAEPPPPGLRDDVLGMIDGGPVADLRRRLESDQGDANMMVPSLCDQEVEVPSLAWTLTMAALKSPGERHVLRGQHPPAARARRGRLVSYNNGYSTRNHGHLERATLCSSE